MNHIYELKVCSDIIIESQWPMESLLGVLFRLKTSKKRGVTIEESQIIPRVFWKEVDEDFILDEETWWPMNGNSYANMNLLWRWSK